VNLIKYLLNWNKYSDKSCLNVHEKNEIKIENEKKKKKKEKKKRGMAIGTECNKLKTTYRKQSIILLATDSAWYLTNQD
jgi:hypothetical protein